MDSVAVEDLSYASLIGSVKRDLANKRNLKAKRDRLLSELKESQILLVRMLDAQRLLSSVSDDNTDKTLNFITGMVNKVLSELFPTEVKRIYMKKKLFAGSKPHINIEVINGEGNTLDLSIQEGTGIAQVISVMYVICLIEIRKGRRFLMLDEMLNGLHAEAKHVLSEIMKIFAEGGFQFIFVEYSLNDLGKIYNVENRGGESHLVDLEGRKYSDRMVYMGEDDDEDSGVDLSILSKEYVEEGKSASEDGVAREITIG